LSHELLKLTSKLYNTPHLTTETYLDHVFTILEDRNQGKFLAVSDTIKPEPRRVQYFADKALGIIDVHGALSDIPYYGMCGETGVSHQSLREEMKALVDMGAKTVVMDSDTSGGMAHMAFESARYIRDLADDNGVKLISYVSAKSYSAGYVYSAVAHEIITNPSSDVGSIGVMIKLRNVSGAMKNMGIEDTYITAGENKVPFDLDGRFTKEFLAEMEEGVLDLYDQFTDHVAMYRGLGKEEVIKLGANSFNAKKALANGLVDKEMTLEEFKNYLENITSGEEMTNPVAKLFSKNKTKETEMSNTEVDVQAQLAALEEKFTAKLETLESTYLSQIAAKDLELNQLKEVFAAQELAKKEAKSAARLATLSAIVGDVEAPALNASLESLSDETFDVVSKSLKAKTDSIEAEMTQEVGNDGKTVVIEDEVLTLEQLADREGARLKALYATPRN
jgi:ClpP class serine protease